MRNRSLLILLSAGLIALGLPMVAAAEPAPADDSSGSYAPGQLLVGFDEGVDARGRSAIHRRKGGRVLERFEFIDADLVSLPRGLTVAAAAGSYRSERGVRAAVPNFERRVVDTIPNDPSFSQLWGLHNTGQTVSGDPGVADADIDAPAAWDLGTGSASTRVAVVDTGIDITHVDLAANIWVNNDPINGIDDDNNGFIDDRNGWDFHHNDRTVYDFGSCGPEAADAHGTHVAGTIGAVGNNSTGVTGVNWTVTLMPLKFIDCDSGFDSNAIKAIEYAVDNGADVINASWGSTDDDALLEDAIEAAGDAGLLFVAATGNDGVDMDDTPFFPASHPLDNLIAVAATDNDDDLWEFSNFGGQTDLAAPGVRIRSTFPEDLYAVASGTSMATPHVTGALALLRSTLGITSPAALRQRILSTVDPLVDLFPGVTESGGRLNLNNAVRQKVLVTETAGTTEPIEGGPADTYTVVLTEAPASNVQIALSAQPEVTLSTGLLTFTPANFATPQTVTVSADDDEIEDGPRFARITHAVTSSDPDFNGSPVRSVLARAADNDAAGIVLNPTTLSLSEGGSTKSYTVRLKSQPTAGVTITLDPDSQVSITSATSLVFTTGNWDEPRTVTVRAVNDSKHESSPHNGKVVHRAASSDPDYDPLSKTLTVNITDNDSCPVISPGGFMAYGSSFTGGVYVAVGDVDGNGCDEIITGAGAGGGPHVRVFGSDGGLRAQGFAYASGFTGGVRVGAGDVDGDGRDEIITGPGPGGGPHLKVFDVSGGSLKLRNEFMAYNPAFTGGIFVAGGDVGGTNDNAEIITGPDRTGGPHVRVFTTGGSVVAETLVYAASFTGGVRVGTVEVDGGSRVELVTGAGSGGGPHVRVFDIVGASFGPKSSFFAFAPGFTGGIFVGGAEVISGSSRQEIMAGAGPGGGPHVRVFNGGGSVLASFFAYSSGFGGGVRVAGGDGDGDGNGEVVTGPGPGGGPHVRLFE
jgi:subtilisin family serine protease